MRGCLAGRGKGERVVVVVRWGGGGGGRGGGVARAGHACFIWQRA